MTTFILPSVSYLFRLHSLRVSLNNRLSVFTCFVWLQANTLAFFSLKVLYLKRDLNPHGQSVQQILSLSRLPITTFRLTFLYKNFNFQRTNAFNFFLLRCFNSQSEFWMMSQSYNFFLKLPNFLVIFFK